MKQRTDAVSDGHPRVRSNILSANLVNWDQSYGLLLATRMDDRTLDPDLDGVQGFFRFLVTCRSNTSGLE